MPLSLLYYVNIAMALGVWRVEASRSAHSQAYLGGKNAEALSDELRGRFMLRIRRDIARTSCAPGEVRCHCDCSFRLEPMFNVPERLQAGTVPCDSRFRSERS